MPFYTYACTNEECKKEFDEMRTYEKRETPATCECGKPANYIAKFKFNAHGLPNGFSSTRSKSRR